MNHPKLSKQTIVTIARTVRAFGEKNEHGPMTISAAEKAGLFSSSSGTVGVTVTVAEGPHTGANAYNNSAGQWFAQYDPDLEFPDRSNRYPQ